MTQISAALVKQLRDKTGAGMGDCKKALMETDGDVEAAVDVLRSKGLKASKAAEATAEGAVSLKVSDDAKAIALVELRCQTDFAARSDNFSKLMDVVSAAVVEHKVGDPEAAKELAPVKEGLQEATAITIRENINVTRAEYKTLEGEGRIGAYVHHNGTIGAAVAINAPAGADADKLDALAREIGMHVTAHDPSPVGLDRDSIPEDLVAREKAIYLKAMEDDPKDAKKPQNIKEKIVEGKLRKFFEERALLEQKFVKNPDQSIRELLAATGKDLGGDVSIAWFERLAVGG